MTSQTNEPAFIIRPFVDADAEALSGLHRRAIVASGNTTYSAKQVQSWAVGLKPSGYRAAIVAGETIEVATDAAGAPIAFSSRTDTRIMGLYVDPDRQHSGVGSALLAQAETALADLGIGLSEIVSSLPAEGFYLRRGYSPVRHLDHTTRGGIQLPVVVVTKLLG